MGAAWCNPILVCKSKFRTEPEIGLIGTCRKAPAFRQEDIRHNVFRKILHMKAIKGRGSHLLRR